MSRYNNHKEYRNNRVAFEDNPKRGRNRDNSYEEEKYRNGRKRQIKHIEIEESDEESDPGIIKFEENNEGKDISDKKMLPWFSKSTKQINDPLLRFHNEIIEFYNYVKPSKKSHSQRMKKFNFIKDKIEEMFPEIEVTPFGSFATQLYLPDGDIDIAVLTNEKYDITDVYNKIYKFLTMKIYANTFKEIEYIRKSKVPLIKFTYEGILVDISVDKPDGIHQIKYVEKIMQFYPEFKYLVFLLKCTLRIRGMAETYSGGIGSFLLSCMLLVYLQSMHEKKSYLTLGEHALEFIRFYALRDDDWWGRKILFVKTGKIVDRKYDQTFFSCMSPQDETHDIGKSAFKIRDAFKVLKNRFNYIMDKNFEEGESVLRVLVNPSEHVFRYLKDNEYE